MGGDSTDHPDYASDDGPFFTYMVYRCLKNPPPIKKM